jgi:hypothetical protein
MYKSGSNEKASIHKYSVFVKQYGANSSEANDYLQKFADDKNFIEEAERIKQNAENNKQE